MLFHDLLYSVRTLRKSTGFSALVIFTLALGIGANTAVFSVIYAALLRPLPYPDSNRIVALYETKTPHDPATQQNVAPGDFLDWRDQSRSFSAIAGFSGFHFTMTGPNGPTHLWGGAVSAGWFDVFGIRPQLGRAFTKEEDRPGAPQVAVLTNRTWRSTFHADPLIVGKSITLNGDSYAVVGVMPPDNTTLHMEIDFWTPLERQILPERMRWRDSRFVQTFARLKPGVTMLQAEDDLNRIATSIKHEHPTGDVFAGALITSLRESLSGDTRPDLLLAYGVVALVLLVACANVANLMLARISGRMRELAIRTALGARPSRLLQQLATESLVLSLGAAVVGIALAEGIVAVLQPLVASEYPDVRFARLDAQVVLFAVGLAALTALLFGVFPSIAVLRSNTEDVLRKASATVSSHRGRQRLRNGIAVAEIACSLVLLSAAGLLIRSLVAIEQVPAGFQTEHREVTLIAIPRMRYQQDHDVVRFYDAVLERIRSAPGIVNATVLFPAPFSGRDFGTTFRLPGSTQTQFNAAELRPTDSHFLSTLELPLLSGRGFTGEDRTDSAPVCVISEAMAHRYWPKQNAVGQFIVLTRGDVLGTQRPRQIVGIVGDVHDRLNLQPPPTVYVPYSQILFPSMNIIVHSAAPISALRTSIDDAVQAVDPDELVRYLVSFNELAAERTAPWRIAITMLGGLAGLALLLSAIGVFAVMSYLVREKTKEFGIRVALGATPWNIRGNVLIQSLQIVLGGIVFGTALSIGATRLISGMLFGIAPADPVTYAMVSLLLIVVAVLAAYIPAHRATRVDPLEALRYE